ncbi:UNVERIFIED_ORG: iron complex outermembrane receptor protein [Sphingomonas sp. R1F5B]
MRKVLLASSMLIAGWGAPVAAQTTGNETAGNSTAGIGDIVVTAQRKSESTQKAAIAIAVLNGDQLLQKGLSSATDLGKAVPALNVQAGGGPLTSFFVRGVGNFTVNGYSDPAVAFAYDGVYMGRATSTSGMFYDLERLEVLKGPQGTLYGRNATAGAINAIPAKPKIGEWSGNASAYYGNYNAFGLQGAINAPIGEHGALRIAGNVVSHDGYMSDGTSDEKNQALRGQMLAELTPDLTVKVGADWSHTGGKGPGAAYAGSYAYSRTTGAYTFVPSGLSVDTGLYSPASQAYRQTLFLGATGRNAAPLDDTAYQNNSFYGTNAEITWKSGIGTFTLLPAWRHSQLDSRFGNPGFVGWIREKDDQVSLEARLATNRVSIFDAILGAYYFDETVNGNYTFAQQQLNAYQAFTSKTKSYAAFGRLTANLSEHFRLVGGLRFTRDEKRFDGQADVFIDTCTVRVAGRPSCPAAPLLPVTGFYTDLTAPFMIAPAGGAAPIGTSGAVLVHAQTPVHAFLPKSKATWRAGVEFDVSPHSLLYATVETGYRSGGFSLSAGYETFQPEYLTAYTIGSKNRFWHNRVQFNLEAFYWDYTNQQVNHSGIDLNGNQGQFTQNVGNSKIKGVEADLQIKATHTTLLSANIQYLDSKYGTYTYSVPVGATPPVTGCAYGVNPANTALYTINCSGKPGYQSPRWTANLGLEQTIPLGRYNLAAAVNTQYKTSRYIAFDFLPEELIGATWTTNAELRLSPKEGHWSLAAYVRNIEGDRIPVSAPNYPAASSLNYITSAPRTFGVRAGVKF